ncbi:hypothetical protein LTR84_004165 [Exophiala bonariae]|uniref:FAD-binding domain-containing protein n=1 Tax=Exophiala bonariae TaxID=1690606 RepID=A0AAV9N5G8_9EURO|nr:hypothetical protein LTR84_004165 [Exophiala bonariae]
MDTKNEIAILGGGPAGMAAALSLIKAGFSVKIFERYSHARPAGNILNLWPPPVHALRCMGVDIDDLGAPCHTTFRSVKGNIRAEVQLPEEILKEYGGGFIGLLRPDLYSRMLDAIPPGTIQHDRQVTDIKDHGDFVKLVFSDGTNFTTPLLIGADGIDSIVRSHLWGASPKRAHNLQIIGGFTFDEEVATEQNECVLVHSRTTQGTYTTIRSKGRLGHQWWILQACPDTQPPPGDLKTFALEAAGEFSKPLTELVAATDSVNCQRWLIRDRVPLKVWSKGRITLAGDAAHATSPYAAYGAGMSICDGYFLAQCLHGTSLHDTGAVKQALSAYEKHRVAHTTEQVNAAFFLGKLFHHIPWPLTWIRDLILDNTSLLQRQVGERNPQEIVAQLKEMGEGIMLRTSLSDGK